jgi:peptidoglycan hydrolase-like protein with peptidoglycan-binding domain
MAYTLEYNDKELSGETNNTGLIDVLIPIDAESAKLSLPDAKMSWQIHFGNLDPIETITGVQARLKGLGYAVGPIDGKEDSRLSALLSSFQQQSGLQVTGKIDAATRSKLEEQHGS